MLLPNSESVSMQLNIGLQSLNSGPKQPFFQPQIPLDQFGNSIVLVDSLSRPENGGLDPFRWIFDNISVKENTTLMPNVN